MVGCSKSSSEQPHRTSSTSLAASGQGAVAGSTQSVQKTDTTTTVKPIKDESWRHDMAAFATAVADIAVTSDIPNEFQLTQSLRSRTAPTRQGRPLWVILEPLYENELHARLIQAFSGQVSWKGKVNFVELDQEKMTHRIGVEFPKANGLPKTFQLTDAMLSIPFDRLPANQAPATGTIFSFTATFKNKKDGEFLDRVFVLYRPSGAITNTHSIGVSLADVVPAVK